MPRLFHRLACAAVFAGGTAAAAQIDIAGPPGRAAFGTRVYALPNGNFVVTDPDAEGGRGNVHLYTAAGSRLATLRGSTTSDRIGAEGVIVLPNGNYLVPSSRWVNAGAAQAGALTWVSGSTGLEGTISAANSLVGTHAGDQVGGKVVVLPNGNYLALSPLWDRSLAASALANAGAATFGSGSSGVAGVVSVTNSLVGHGVNEQVGASVVVLGDGNVALASPSWADAGGTSVGAVSWVDGQHGASGDITPANALIGTGDSQVLALTNGAFYVDNSRWSDGSGAVGALTWCAAGTPCLGSVSAGNSLIGRSAGDLAAPQGLALRGGRMLLGLTRWSDAEQQIAEAGAVMVLPADGSLRGRLAPSMLLLRGSHAGDHVGAQLYALDNGKAVALSPSWRDGTDVGAVTWIDPSGGALGAVSALNSLLGDEGASLVVRVLAHGHYTVACSDCDIGGMVDAGAVVWGGDRGITGRVASSSGLHGTHAGDRVGAVVVALTDGNYVVASPSWDNSILFPNVGAATWVDGSTGMPSQSVTQDASVGAQNSLIGSRANDAVGERVIGLANGNYLVCSPHWSSAAATAVGAATWGDGGRGSTGYVSTANSLVGASADDHVGYFPLALPNGNYAVGSPHWDDVQPSGTAADSGAVTWGDGSHGTAGVVSRDNSLVPDGQAGANLGEILQELASGDFIARSGGFDLCDAQGGCTPDVGAHALVSGRVRTHGFVSPANSVVGSVRGEGGTQSRAFNTATDVLIVGRPLANTVSLLPRSLFRDGFD